MNFTQIGSLPFDNIEQALDYSFQHSIPFVPDLPALNSHEFMLEQAKQSLDKPYQQLSLESFMNRAKDFQGIIKNQLPGPICMSHFLDWEFDQAFKVWKSLLIDRVETLKKYNHQTWVFIDEPTFFDHYQEKHELIFETLLKVKDVFFAIHYCGKTKMKLDNWPNGLGLSYDVNHHQNISIAAQIPGISSKLGLKGDYIAVTPSCGLWGHDKPADILKTLKMVAN